MEFSIKNKEFKADKLNVFDQLKVARKLAPLIGDFFSQTGINELLKLKNNEEGMQEKALTKVIPAITKYISCLGDEDVNDIVYPCLAVVKIKQNNIYSPIFDKKAQALMFDNISMCDMLTIVIYVIKDSLANFLQDLQGNQLIALQI